MSIHLRCDNPECRMTLRVRDELAGKHVRCPTCGKRTPVPDAPAANGAEPTEEPDAPARPRRKRRKKGSAGWQIPSVVILGMPLPVVLLLVVVGGGLIGVGIFAIRRAGGKAGGDWHKSYDAFLAQLKVAEERRPKNGRDGADKPDYFFLTPQQKYVNVKSFAYGIGRQRYTDETRSADEPIEWEAAFLGLDKDGTLRFDLETPYRSTVKNVSDFSGGVEYAIQFFAAHPEDWKAIPEGKKVRFAGRIQSVFQSNYTREVGLRYKVRIEVKEVTPLSGGAG